MTKYSEEKNKRKRNVNNNSATKEMEKVLLAG